MKITRLLIILTFPTQQEAGLPNLWSAKPFNAVHKELVVAKLTSITGITVKLTFFYAAKQ